VSFISSARPLAFWADSEFWRVIEDISSRLLEVSSMALACSEAPLEMDCAPFAI
jgi:hypothetical protein